MVMDNAVADKHDQVVRDIGSRGTVLVALSGGVDSSLLLALAVKSGAQVESVTVISDIITRDDMEFSNQVASGFDVKHHVLNLDLLSVEEVKRNHQDRCYHCKKTMFQAIRNLARERGIEYILEGSNADDDPALRPGSRALEEMNIGSPFISGGIGKQEIRQLAREYSLPTSHRPASPCLATRVAYGQELSVKLVQQVRHCEQWLNSHGFAPVRVRVHGKLARIEFSQDQQQRFCESGLAQETNIFFREQGFTQVTVDLAGYREGSMMEERN